MGLRPKPPASACGDPFAPRRSRRGAPCAPGGVCTVLRRRLLLGFWSGCRQRRRAAGLGDSLARVTARGPVPDTSRSSRRGVTIVSRKGQPAAAILDPDFPRGEGAEVNVVRTVAARRSCPRRQRLSIRHQPEERTRIEQEPHDSGSRQRCTAGHRDERRSTACWARVPWPPSHLVTVGACPSVRAYRVRARAEPFAGWHSPAT